ncbi:MAG: leucine-rich repeat domain-containing protein [Bacteroidaceae bacterium]|nr:leucine-rich repeat domain-containing protein [Bacteroidaceae bacterium]
MKYCDYGNNYWSTSIDVIYEGWEPKAYTIHVPTAGQFGNLLLNEIQQWTDVDELTVSGSLNADDLALISRMTQIRKLDLSQTDITSFIGCNGLTRLATVVLPSTVTNIGEYAFYNCVRLESITLPNVTEIGYCAFNGCSSLKSIELPMATTLGSYAFQYCGNLQSVKIPAVTEIQNECFYRCYALNDIDLSNVQIIGRRAFSECLALTKVDLSSATELSSEIFEYCRKLSDVTLSDKLSSIPSNMFYGCDSLTSITLPSSVQSIGGDAFHSTSLKSIVIPEGCTTIGSSAFYDCPMETISIPSTITQIGGNAFSSSVVKDLYCYVIVPFSTYAFSNMSSATLHVPEFSVNAYRLHDDWYNFFQTVAIEGDIEKLNINQDFTIYAYNGLASGVDVTLDYGGYYNEWYEYVDNSPAHLTVNANSAFSVGSYLQYQNLYSYDDYYYDYELDAYVYGKNPYCTTLITQNEMTADSACTHAYLPTNRWSFISFPYDVNVSDISVPEGTLWVVRKYSGEDRAAMTGNTWQNVTEGTVLKAGEGYIFHCNNNNSDGYSSGMVEVVFPAVNGTGTLFAHDDVVIPLNEYVSEFAHNRSWNLVGNPYPAYYNTQKMEFDAPITVWNGYGYTAYSLLDDDYVLTPNEAFFVQRTADSESITFRKDGRMHSAGLGYTDEYVVTRSASVERHVYNFLLSDNNYADRARLVMNEMAQMEYEASRDASKFMSNNTDVQQLYITDGGVKYAIDERPMGNGIVGLGAYFGKTGEYTLSLANNPNSEVSVMLTDKLTGTVTDLTTESYTFNTEEGTVNDRFVIALMGTTGIENSVADETPVTAVYTLDGKLMPTTDNLPAGIYIVKKGNVYTKYVVGE